MSWGKPWAVEPDKPPPLARGPRRWSAIAIACAAAHVAAVGAWLLLRDREPMMLSRPPTLQVALARFPSPPPKCPEPEATTPPPHEEARPRFDGLAVNPARPSLVLAWSRSEVALSNDDAGGSLAITNLDLPAEDGPMPVGVVTPSGAALVMRAGRPWWRSIDGVQVEVVAPPFRDEVRLAATDGRRIVAMVDDENDVSRFMVSRDDGRTWTEGPTPPNDVYDLVIRTDGTIVVAWMWSASCGGGGEGFATLGPKDAEWKSESRGAIAPLAADGWIYDLGFGGPDRAVTASGPENEHVLGPAVPVGVEPWFTTDGRSTYIGLGKRIVSARRGVFTLVDGEAPLSLHAVRIDGLQRLVGLTGRGIARRQPDGTFVDLPARKD